MGNCCSDVAGGQSAVGGTYSSLAANASNEAVDAFFKSRGYNGLSSEIEVRANWHVSAEVPELNDATNYKHTVHKVALAHSHVLDSNIFQLSLSATDLRDRDVLSKSDPMAVLYIKGNDGSLRELGRTEVVLNSLSPKWIKKFSVTYQFEMVQNLVLRVYDVDTQFHGMDVKTLKLEEQQLLGEAICTISKIATKLYRTVTIDLTREEVSTRKCGQLTVYAEESVTSKTTVELVLRCSDLESKDLFSKSDPFLVISKATEHGMLVPICKTEVRKNDHEPKWNPIFLSIQQVGSKDSPLLIECFNFNSNGKHDLLGKVQKSLAELERLHSAGSVENLFIPMSVGKNHQRKVLKSQLIVDKYSETIQHTFLDYLAGGYELNFMVAVDFTGYAVPAAERFLRACDKKYNRRDSGAISEQVGDSVLTCKDARISFILEFEEVVTNSQYLLLASNGNPRLPDSLHYIDPSGRPSAYQRAILEVGGVLQFYDYDKKFPAWGFGARPIDGPVSHCFNLNGSSTYCEVEGIHGIMMAYSGALSNVSLAGPTLFGHVVTQAAQIASGSVARNERKYFVLLIITDGVITDLQETKDAFVMASDLPLSILIVGVGGADFKEMEILDADKGERLESSSGRVASRDIVQFVPFRDVQSGEDSVVRSLLAELPTQFLNYVRARGIGLTA
ncbi:hypothetical protein SASPL_117299 [Salvia splendens]|uniref:C2 domain-containing protein n=1 Tax=Salvia splendens TaxID=180675 RepID=A0A8X8ZY12_SALSN|nr:hypothetical protein SASPL_117299 [Salvia splendens]